MKRLLTFLGLLTTFAVAGDASAALNPCTVQPYALAATLLAATPKDCTIGYAQDSDAFYVRANGAWVAISTLVSLTGDNGGTFANGTNNMWDLSENSETVRFNLDTSNQLTLSSSTGVADLLTAFDLSLGGGASALNFTAASSSITTTDNSATGLVVGSTGALSVLTLDTRDAAEGLILTGYETISSTLGVTGVTTLGAGAGALTFSNTAASVLLNDNDTSALDIGSTGTTQGVRISTEDNKELWTWSGAGAAFGVHAMGGGNVTLDASDCGKVILWNAADDGFTTTLPATIAGCVFRFVYTGANGGALMDISPNASDGIYGGCTLAASVVTFSGTDDADVGITKATIKKGDNLTLVGDGTDGWVTVGGLGICANN